EALASEVLPEQLRQLGVVVDQQHARAARSFEGSRGHTTPWTLRRPRAADDSHRAHFSVKNFRYARDPAADSVRCMARAPASIISPIGAATSCGSTSAIQLTRARSGPSAKTWNEALWWRERPPTAAYASRCCASSTSTMSSRTTRPLANVTMR